MTAMTTAEIVAEAEVVTTAIATEETVAEPEAEMETAEVVEAKAV